MDLDVARDFVRDHPRAVLATLRRDGTPQMSPVLCAVDDAGRILISTRETAMKTLNLRRDPRAWLCVLSEGFFGDWVSLHGTVDILSLPEAMEPLVEYYRLAVGEHPDWDDYRAAMTRDRRVLVRLDLTHAGPDVSG